MKPHVDIIDPIHDFVRVHGHELSVIESPLFQRLRRIRQLSGAHLVYPSAQHSRFEHSLGVMHIAGQAGAALLEKGHVDEDGVRVLRLAGLLHDIGHGPFSHVFEGVMKAKKASHEDYGRRMILGSEIGDMLGAAGFDKGRVARTAFGESGYGYLDAVISGPLSADMMDYLLRDGYFTGAEHAKIDHKRMTRSFDVHKGMLALERSALLSFESMVISRYQMFKAVYYHRTVRAAEVMLQRALELADGELGFTGMDLGEYAALTDERVLAEIISSGSPKLKGAREFAQDYQDRRLLKCAFERDMAGQGHAGPAELRRELAAKSGVGEDEIFIDTSFTPSISLSPSKDRSESITLVTGDGRHADEMPLSGMPLVSAISGSVNILRVYTHGKHRNKVEIAARTVLGGS